MTDTFCIRLKPYSPRNGNVTRDYTAPWGAKYVNGIWYEEIPEKYAEYLRTVHQRPDVISSPLAFDVCASKAEADAVILREEAEKQGKLVHPAARKSVSAPTDPIPVVASKDLNRPNPSHNVGAERDRDSDVFFGGPSAHVPEGGASQQTKRKLPKESSRKGGRVPRSDA